MNEFVYVVFDVVAGRLLTSFSAVNDSMAIRNNLPALSRVAPVSDLVLKRVGVVDVSTCVITPIDVVSVSWDSYKFPEKKVNTDVKVGSFTPDSAK